MRTIEQCFTHLKEADPQTAWTACAIRRLVRSGTLPAVRIGNKYLIALEVLDEFCSTPTGKKQSGIRQVV